MERITALQQGLLAPATPAATATADPTAFASTLQDASATAAGAPGTTAGALGATGAAGVTATAATPGQRALQFAQAEVGQTEQPPGSNDSPRIAQYRKATAGSGVGPWCAYFASWAARQAGTPLGDAGQGFGAVSDVWAWAQRTGKAQPAGSKPAPGDLIVWGSEHIGIVESVDPNGTIHTIEGNSSDAVSRRTYGPDGGGATGYVHLG